MSSRDDKRARFESRGATNPKNRLPIYIGAAAVILAVAIGGILYAGRQSGSDTGYIDVTQAEDVTASESTRLDAVFVESTVDSGNLLVPMKAIEDNTFVEFNYSKDGKELPLLAYKTNDGRVTAAVRMCEPCNSQSFHIEYDEIVCNACGSRWKLEDLSGVSGGCLTYPPDKVDAKQIDGNLAIPESEIADWQPRV